MSRPKTTYSDAPQDAVYVSVYCDGHQTDTGPSHADKRWHIATFTILEGALANGEEVYWTVGTGRTYTTAAGKTLTFDTKRTSTPLVGDRPVTNREARDDPAGLRSRHNLSCRRCGLTLAVRTEKLNPVLTTLHAHGVLEVSLLGLGAILL